MTRYDDYLVRPNWLATHLDDPDLRIVDCRFTGDPRSSHQAYLTGHIPGAVHSYWLDDLCADDTRVTTFLPDEGKAASSLGRLGIAADTDVIAYADNANLYATRLWHVLVDQGHTRIRLLDGGIEAWTTAGYPLDTGDVVPAPRTFHPRPARPTVITAAELRERLHDPSLQILDTRTPEEFAGTTARAARGGHIPGAILLPWNDLLDDAGHVEKQDALARHFSRVGLDPAHEVATYCQGGVRAAHTAIALALAGYSTVRIYAGSWAEWGNNPSLPLGASVPVS